MHKRITLAVLTALATDASGVCHLPAHAGDYVEPLNQHMHDAEIDNDQRTAAFLGQVFHETNCLQWMEELASGHEYEGRKDLGNIEPGDGVKFKGRGLLQVTGRANYEAFETYLGAPKGELLADPSIITKVPDACVMSATWFWHNHEARLNVLADGWDITSISKVVNGGMNGLESRKRYSEHALQLLRELPEEPAELAA